MIDQHLPLARLADETAEKFQQRFGRPPQWVVAAPGRVNLIGEHTDYNDGFVLPMAIDRYTVLAAGRSPGGEPPRLRMVSGHKQGEAVIPLNIPLQPGQPAWANYVLGVAAGFAALGAPLASLDILVESNVPLGGGLSSSAALEVAAATLFEVVTGHRLDPVEKALLCQKAEHEFAGVPCGIMDQFTSALGRENHLLLLDCRSRQAELVPLSDPAVSVLIINTNVKHHLAGGEYARRRQQCEAAARHLRVRALRDAHLDQLKTQHDQMDPVVFRRARHVITEIGRTVRAATAIKASDWPEVGSLMYDSHDSLRDDYEVSCAELDEVVEIARKIGPGNGMIGCRMTGGGFGGCAVSVVQSAATRDIAKKIHGDYQQKTGIQPALFVSRPAAGATVLKA